MSKALLYALVAAVDIIIAVIAFRRGRVIIPAVLVLAALCFIAAAIGHARGAGQKSEH